MTREEAIKRLNWVREQIDEKPIHYTHQALDMAIKALNVPDMNIGDMISRQAAIEIFDCSISGVPFNVVRYVAQYADKMLVKIKALPSAQPSPCEFCKHNDISDDVACLRCSAERRTDGRLYQQKSGD